jgi:ubiquinone/menaquinone biosynthesis C-methylase UbiE
MTEPAGGELIDAAKAYEALFVPALFRQWAAKVADAAALRTGQRVLDVACGTGVLAREAAARVGAAGVSLGSIRIPACSPSPRSLHQAWNGAKAQRSRCRFRIAALTRLSVSLA